LEFVDANWVRGDEIKAYGALPSYATLNLLSSGQMTTNDEVDGLINNATNARAELRDILRCNGRSQPAALQSAPGFNQRAGRLLWRREAQFLILTSIISHLTA